MSNSTDATQRYRRALAGEPFPAALVDLDAVDRNFDRLLAVTNAAGKKLRVASKSIRCLQLLRYLTEKGGASVVGLMTYTASETEFLASQGFKDLLLAYPTLHPHDAQLLAKANQSATAAVVVDAPEHLVPLSAAAVAAGVEIPVLVDVDMAWRPAPWVHLGVRRSPLRAAEEVVALAKLISGSRGLRFHGLLAYEAQIAGLTDHGPFSPWQNPLRRALKHSSRPQVEARRAELRSALSAASLAPKVFNGGGSGSLGWAAQEPALTEVTAGSGFLDSHLFDSYRDLTLDPAIYFALQVVRRPAPGLVTCHGGGFIASGEIGPDRLPLPALPPGLKLLPLEGAGEVQTPLQVPHGLTLALGDPVFFRPAKTGELAEHFNEYLLVRGDRIEARAPTYRGMGHCFLG